MTPPIFINCYSRGGSNILWNMLLSHPLVCSPIRETLDIFHFGLRPLRADGWSFALTSLQPRFFDQWSFHERRPLNALARRTLDRGLRRWMHATLTDPEMVFAAPGRRYTEHEVRTARLAAKNNNGLAYLTPRLREVYPDASFVGLARHPVALYESHQRRRISRDPIEFGARYNAIARALARDTEDGALLLRFEDVVSRPLEILQTLYAHTNLDFDPDRKLRFKAKAHWRADGSRGSDFEEGSHVWFEPSALDAYFQSDIDALQGSRLDHQTRDAVMQATLDGRALLGYG